MTLFRMTLSDPSRSQHGLSSSRMMIYQMVPFSMTLNDSPNFKAPLEYPRNGTR